MDFSDHIKANRPQISENSIKTYNSILNSLFKKFSNEGDQLNVEWFHNEDNLINKLKDLPANIRKTLFSALISVSPNDKNKKYKMAMMSDAQKYREDMLNQTKTPQEEKNWVSQDEIKTKFDEMKKEVRGLWNKPNLTKGEYKQIQDFILLCLTSGVFIPPRRSLDWVNFKIKNINTDTNNYLDKNNLVFNAYKGSQQKGQQVINIKGNPLLNLLKKFIKINPFEYLIVDSNGGAMSAIKINQHIKKIFNGKSGINIFRHSYLSDKYKMTQMKELNEDAKQMGTSPQMILNQYVKKD